MKWKNNEGGKGMKIQDFIDAMEKEVPPRFACSWDHVGLLVGDSKASVSRILVSLDAHDAAVDHAVNAGCQLIVTHHPLLFHPMEKVVEQDFIGRRVRTMIKNEISCFAMHTNFDVVKMADINARDLGLNNPEVLSVLGDENGNPYGFGRVGDVDPLLLGSFAGRVKNVCRLKAVRVYGDLNKIVSRAAVASGSGRSSIDDAIEKKADVIVTGDVDYHTAIDAVSKGIAVIDAGHYGTEFCFIDYTAKMIKDMFPDLIVITEDIRQPYSVL